MDGALTVEGPSGPRVNPLVRISAASAKDMIAYASHFGMSAAARARIAVGPNGGPAGGGKFDGLLG